MKRYLTFLIILTLFFSCKARQFYVPNSVNKEESKTIFHRDSIFMHDSVFVKSKGDTIWLERYKTVYKERLVRDSIYKCDSILVPYPVVEEREVNRLNSLQSFQIWCRRILLVLLILFFGVRAIRSFIKR